MDISIDKAVGAAKTLWERGKGELKSMRRNKRAKEKYCRRIRGEILKLLSTEYPRFMDLKLLHCVLNNLSYTIIEEELQSHLGYLEKKKYLAKKSIKEAQDDTTEDHETFWILSQSFPG